MLLSLKKTAILFYLRTNRAVHGLSGFLPYYENEEQRACLFYKTTADANSGTLLRLDFSFPHHARFLPGSCLNRIGTARDHRENQHVA